jgi:hypothetical protein
MHWYGAMDLIEWQTRLMKVEEDVILMKYFLARKGDDVDELRSHLAVCKVTDVRRHDQCGPATSKSISTFVNHKSLPSCHKKVTQ